MKALALGLDGSYLFIQGPPGSGKTWTGARMSSICSPAGGASASRRQSHKAIHNLLDEIEKVARETACASGAEEVAAGNPESEYDGEFIKSDRGQRDLRGRRPRRPAPRRHRLALRPRGARQRARLSRSSTRPARSRWRTRSRWARAARNLVLLGDPAPARPGLPGRAPGGLGRLRPRAPARRRADDSGGPRHVPRAQLPHASGRVPTSSRRSSTRAGCTPTRRRPASDHVGRRPGIRFAPVDHDGNRVLVRRGGGRDREADRAPCAAAPSPTPNGTTRPLREDDFMVVAPYNAQVRSACATALPAGVARRHRRQVPGPGGAGRLLLDGHLQRRGRAPQPRRSSSPATA